MTTATISAETTTSAPLYPTWRLFTSAEYQRLGEIGVLRPDEPLDLRDGAILQRSDPPTRRLFTVADYQQMAELHILDADERVELLAGEIFTMAPLGIRHSECVDQLTELLTDRRGDTFRVRVQSSLHLSQGSQPQPDLLLLRRRPAFYGKAAPTPADVLLLIEVSDTTLEHDRQVKLPLYAKEGIAEVWIVNLVSDILELYTQPVGSVYTMVQVARRGESVTATTVPGLVLRVDDILP